ncbi:hypothetical protein CFD26_102421 [Aspergillus turcosus]|uniref:Uncharacterized protein n=1 Tax=Aspergillus turcosus TaxID=1245748 RepID=A0A421CU24_9EURO|nr:hypothetical protein CFD26_102421 [Aspergillus turcosus]
MKDLFRNGTIVLNEITETNSLPSIEDYEAMFKYIDMPLSWSNRQRHEHEAERHNDQHRHHNGLHLMTDDVKLNHMPPDECMKMEMDLYKLLVERTPAILSSVRCKNKDVYITM